MNPLLQKIAGLSLQNLFEIFKSENRLENDCFNVGGITLDNSQLIFELAKEFGLEFDFKTGIKNL